MNKRDDTYSGAKQRSNLYIFGIAHCPCIDNGFGTITPFSRTSYISIQKFFNCYNSPNVAYAKKIIMSSAYKVWEATITFLIPFICMILVEAIN